jgi:hypothetical protein
MLCEVFLMQSQNNGFNDLLFRQFLQNITSFIHDLSRHSHLLLKFRIKGVSRKPSGDSVRNTCRLFQGAICPMSL